MLPRLLYVGDVPVEDTVASGTLLFRLFEQYPPALLCIVETNLMDGGGNSRLPNVHHEKLGLGIRPLLRTRFDLAGKAWEWLGAPWHASHLGALVSDFAPQAVVTTVPFSSWAIAHHFARRHTLPLHLLLWDDILSTPVVPNVLRRSYARDFLAAYRHAQSRFCISSKIEAFYRDLSGSSGTVVLPFAAENLFKNAISNDERRPSSRRFTFAFTGSLFLQGYRRALQQFARACAETDCELLVIGTTLESGTEETTRFPTSVVRHQAYLPVTEMVEFVRNEAAATVLVGSFEPTEERYCSLLFPSRLVAYAATGLPCFGYGPASFTGIEWLCQHTAAEAVCVDQDHSRLVQLIRRFVEAKERHAVWGRSIFEAGADDFSLEKARAAYFGEFMKFP